ncbi:MAG: hypothetical protein K6T54_05885 [Ignavibacterium sp.]|nr:hypothetical protein [Ignavibacterium sp.]
MILKTKKYIAALIILSYFALSVANVIHFHHITINTNSLENVSEFQFVQKVFNHSFFECTVHNAFNSLHHLTDLQFAYSLVLFLQPQNISLKNTQANYSYLIYSSVLLRAPPELLT